MHPDLTRVELNVVLEELRGHVEQAVGETGAVVMDQPEVTEWHHFRRPLAQGIASSAPATALTKADCVTAALSWFFQSTKW